MDVAIGCVMEDVEPDCASKKLSHHENAIRYRLSIFGYFWRY
jgi:sugar diacid utilization regulator